MIIIIVTIIITEALIPFKSNKWKQFAEIVNQEELRINYDKMWPERSKSIKSTSKVENVHPFVTKLSILKTRVLLCKKNYHKMMRPYFKNRASYDIDVDELIKTGKQLKTSVYREKT